MHGQIVVICINKIVDGHEAVVFLVCGCFNFFFFPGLLVQFVIIGFKVSIVDSISKFAHLLGAFQIIGYDFKGRGCVGRIFEL